MKNKKFEQTVKQNLIASGVMFVIFSAVYILAKMGVLNDSPFSSLGISGAICCIVTFIRNKTLFHNKEKWAKAEVAVMDERNIFIEKQAYSAYAMLSFVCLFVAILVCGFVAPQYAEVLSWVLAGNAVIIVGCIFYFSKKY